MGFLTCESRQQAIEDASCDHCQLIVIANALSQASEDTLDTGCFGRLYASHIQVVDDACQACQAWLLNGKALDEGFEGNPLANVAEPGPIKIKAERIAWAVTGLSNQMNWASASMKRRISQAQANRSTHGRFRVAHRRPWYSLRSSCLMASSCALGSSEDSARLIAVSSSCRAESACVLNTPGKKSIAVNWPKAS